MQSSLTSTLTDRSYRSPNEPAWEAEHALDAAASRGCEGEVVPAFRAMTEAMTPAPAKWFHQRLPVLWTMFMTAREVEPNAAKLWLMETTYLLSDLPHDIVAHAIDEAVRRSRHGFMPTVGEIRAFADPLFSDRRQQAERLGKMVNAIADPEATAERVARRALRARTEEAHQRLVAGPAKI